MMKKILFNRVTIFILRTFFGLFYNKKYLRGLYFDEKIMGWLWAFKGLPGRLFGDSRKAPWPVNPQTIVSSRNIEFDVNNINIFQTPGCYWQTHCAKIVVGSDSYVDPNVGIITTNHDVNDLHRHSEGKDIIIGNSCWIGMNSVVLPGVILGDHVPDQW